MKKRILSLTLVVLLILSLLPTAALAATSGSCGDNTTWSFNDATGTLTISGTGAMKDYRILNNMGGTDVPWEKIRDNIQSVIIDEGITRIGNCAFVYCINLTAATISESVTSIGNSAFWECAFLTVTIPKNVISIAPGAFSYCSNLTTFSVESGNTAFSSPDGILYNKAATTLVAFPEGKAMTFTVPQGVKVIGEQAFRSNSSLTSLTISSGVTSIGSAAFSDCRALVAASLPDTVTSIGDSAFMTCMKLAAITIPNSVTSIGDYAFNGNYSLASVTISNGVTSIGKQAFERCLALTAVTIPASVSTIGIRAFVDCENLANIYVDDSSTAYASADGILYDKAKTTLVQCPAGKKGTLTIPASVTRIDESAFEACSGLTAVTLPETVVSIGKAAFRRCFEALKGGLTMINIPSGVTKIEAGTFALCASLTAVTIPNGVTSIGKEAFSGCKMDSVVIPDSVTFIGERAFRVETTIYGKKGGYAETYANENNLKFSVVSSSAATNSAIAYASTQLVAVDGKAVEFQMYALKDVNGNDTNYVKLRDVAVALSNTAVQFDVVWDNVIVIKRGQPYTSRNGQENKTPYSGNQPFTPTVAAVKTGDMINNLAAFIITDSKGNGSTYCKLRDIGKLLNFQVGWSAEKGVFIESTISYDGKGYRDISQGIGEENPYYEPYLGIGITHRMDNE